jgi:hypothetical protein
MVGFGFRPGIEQLLQFALPFLLAAGLLWRGGRQRHSADLCAT